MKTRAWACGFCYNNSLVCKQMTTFSPLLLVSAQIVNIQSFFRMNLQQNTCKFKAKSQDKTVEFHQNHYG